MIVCVLLSFKDGSTALFKAAYKGHNSVIEELLKFSPSVGLLKVKHAAIDFNILGNLLTHSQELSEKINTTLMSVR